MNQTDFVVCSSVIILLVWEAWTLTNKKQNDTISESIWRVAYKRPLIPFLVGMLMGHFFWLPANCGELVR
jgi:hypothetical protein